MSNEKARIAIGREGLMNDWDDEKLQGHADAHRRLKNNDNNPDLYEQIIEAMAKVNPDYAKIN